MARLPFRRLAPAGLAAGLLLSGGVLTACGAAASAAGDSGASTAAAVTSAATTTVTQTAARSAAAQRQAAFQSDLKSALDGLVKQGTLNATQEQAVVTALAQRPAGNFRRGTATGSSTATARSGNASGGRGAGQRPGGQQAFEKRALDPLVQQGTLTADQETAVLQAVQQAMPARRPTGAPTPRSSSNGQG